MGGVLGWARISLFRKVEWASQLSITIERTAKARLAAPGAMLRSEQMQSKEPGDDLEREATGRESHVACHALGDGMWREEGGDALDPSAGERSPPYGKGGESPEREGAAQYPAGQSPKAPCASLCTVCFLVLSVLPCVKCAS